MIPLTTFHSNSYHINENVTILSNIYTNRIINTLLTTNELINQQTGLIKSNLTVVSNLQSDSLFATNIKIQSALFNNVTITNNLSILGKEIVHNILEVRGDAYLNGLKTTNLTFSGNLNLSNLNINQSLYAPNETILGDLTVNKNAYINTALIKHLDTNINELTISNIILNQNINIPNQIQISSDLTILGQANIGKLKTTNLTFVDNLLITYLTVVDNFIIDKNEYIEGNLNATKLIVNNAEISNLLVLSSYNDKATIVTDFSTLNMNYSNVTTLSNIIAYGGIINNATTMNVFLTNLTNQQNILVGGTGTGAGHTVLNFLECDGSLTSSSILTTRLSIQNNAYFTNLTTVNTIMNYGNETLLSNLYLYGSLLYPNQIIHNATVFNSLSTLTSMTILGGLTTTNVNIGNHLYGGGGSGGSGGIFTITNMTALSKNIFNVENMREYSAITSNIQANSATFNNSLLSVLGNISASSILQTNSNQLSAIIPNILVSSTLSCINMTILPNFTQLTNITVVREDRINGDITILGTAIVPNYRTTALTTLAGQYTNMTILTDITTLGNQRNTNLYINKSFIGNLSNITNIVIASQLTISNLVKYSDLIVGNGETILGNLSILTSLTTSNLYNTNITSFQLIATNLSIIQGGPLTINNNANISNINMLAGIANSSNLITSYLTAPYNVSNNITVLYSEITNSMIVSNTFIAANATLNQFNNTIATIINLSTQNTNNLSILTGFYNIPVTATNLTVTNTLYIQNATFTNMTNTNGFYHPGNETILFSQLNTGSMQLNSGLTLLSMANVANIANLIVSNLTVFTNLNTNQNTFSGSLIIQNNANLSNLTAFYNNTILTATVTNLTTIGYAANTNLVIGGNLSILQNNTILGNLTVLQTMIGTNIYMNTLVPNTIISSNMSTFNNTEAILIQGNETVLGNIQILNPSSGNPRPYINNWNTIVSTNINVTNLWVNNVFINTNFTVVQNENIGGNLTNTTGLNYANAIITTGNTNPGNYECVNTNLQIQSLTVTNSNLYLNAILSTLLVNNIAFIQTANINTVFASNLIVTNLTNTGTQYITGNETVLQSFQTNTILSANNSMANLTVLSILTNLISLSVLGNMQVSNIQFLNSSLTGINLLYLDGNGYITVLQRTDWSYLSNITSFYYSSLNGSSSVIMDIRPTSLNIGMGLGSISNQIQQTATGLYTTGSYLVSILTNLPESGVTAGLTGQVYTSLAPFVSLLTTNASLQLGGNMIVNGSVSANNALMYRNKILNGAMNVNQYNNSSILVTGSVGVSRTFLIDRYRQFSQYTSGQLQLTYLTNLSTADAPFNYGFTNAFMYSVIAGLSILPGAINFFIPTQIIEDAMITDLEWGTSFGKSITVSFWIKSNVLIHTLTITSPSYTNFYISQFTLSSAGTWNYITITIPPPPIGTNWLNEPGYNGRGLVWGIDIKDDRYQNTIIFNQWQTISPTDTNNNMWSTAGNYLIFTGVQLEVGTVATPFEWKPYLIELNLCQRYFERIYPNTNGNFYGVGSLGTISVLCNYMGVMSPKKINSVNVIASAPYTVLNANILDYSYSEPTVNIRVTHIVINRGVYFCYLPGAYVDVTAELL